MTEPPKKNEINYPYFSLLNLGLSTAAFAGLLSLLQIKVLDLDDFLKASLYCFATAMPLNLMIGILIHPSRARNLKVGELLLIISVFTISSIIAIIGFAGIFFHFSISAGVLFIIIVIISAYLYFRLSKINKE